MVGDRLPHDLGLRAVFLYGVADSGTMVRHDSHTRQTDPKRRLHSALKVASSSSSFFALIAALIIFTLGATARPTVMA
jgi:hypothetical protein